MKLNCYAVLRATLCSVFSTRLLFRRCELAQKMFHFRFSYFLSKVADNLCDYVVSALYLVICLCVTAIITMSMSCACQISPRIKNIIQKREVLPFQEVLLRVTIRLLWASNSISLHMTYFIPCLPLRSSFCYGCLAVFE